MSDSDKETMHHLADGIDPLPHRAELLPKRSKSADPISQELCASHRLSEESFAGSEELAERLSKLQEGLEGLDGGERSPDGAS